MTEQPDQSPGIREAAKLLLSLGEEAAAQVIKLLSASEVQRLGAAMAQVGSVSTDEMSGILGQFFDNLDSQTSIGSDSEAYIRSTLNAALGETKAAGIIDRIISGQSGKGLELFKWMDARGVADCIKLEHPQTIAVILAYLEPSHAAEVLVRLREDVRAEVLIRIATLDGVQPSALKELDEVIERQFSAYSPNRTAALGGAKTAAGILNNLESSQESSILGEIRTGDAVLANTIEELIFTFDDLLEMGDRDMQELLRVVPTETLVPALKAADAVLRAKFLKNMSQRAGEMLADDLATGRPIKASDADKAQKEILAAARTLSDAGTISLGAKEDGYV